MFCFGPLKGSVSRDFRPQFFSWFEPIWTPDKQAKVFSNSVLILPRYSITKFEKFDSAVCMTPWSQNYRFSKYPLKEFILIVPLKATRNSQSFRFWLCGEQFDSAEFFWEILITVYHTVGLDSALGCTPRSFLKIRISRQNRYRIRKYFSLFIKGLHVDGLEFCLSAHNFGPS